MSTMKRTSEYSAQELAIMSREQLLGVIRHQDADGAGHAVAGAAAASGARAARPGRTAGAENGVGPSPEALREIGGL